MAKTLTLLLGTILFCIVSIMIASFGVMEKLFETVASSEESLPVDNKQLKVPHEPLNVIIFYPDDWRHDDLGDTSPILSTPFFSWLAQQGIRFTHNCVTTSICWISRATLFTGQWASRHGSIYLFRPKFASIAEQWSRTWPYLLQKQGYWVGHVGKWQFQNLGGYQNKIFNFSSYFEGTMWYDNGKLHTATRAKDTAIQFLQERPKDRPFALTVAFYPPKGSADPNNAVPEYLNMYQNTTIPEPYNRTEALKLLPPFLQDDKTSARSRYNWRFVDKFDYQTTMKTYYAVISHIDSMCRQVVDEIMQQGIYNQTLIIVTADNGEFHAAHALSDKWYPYQESIRVPLIVRDPRMPQQRRGTLEDSMTLNVDLATTILGAAGLGPAEGMQGRDIADLYLSTTNTPKKPWRSEFYYEFPDIQGDIPPSRALVRKDWKYIQWNKHDYEQLFHLEKDPFEFHDLARKDEFAALKKEMKERLDELRFQVMEPGIPETACDPLWPAGTNYSSLPNCSPERPNVCCPPIIG